MLSSAAVKRKKKTRSTSIPPTTSSSSSPTTTLRPSSTSSSCITFFVINHISPRSALFIGLLLRIALVLYGLWQDGHMVVKYTDIDYDVFSDAAEFVANGKSPYARSTYRYTPLLAWMMIPNIWTSRLFGKVLFVLTDLAIAYLIGEILRMKLKRTRHQLNGSNNHRETDDCDYLENTLQTESPVDRVVITIAMLIWLLNPFSINISTRGNAESIISLGVLLSLYYLIQRKIALSAAWFGLAVHFKIYPLVYAVTFFLYLRNEGEEYPRKRKSSSASLSLLEALKQTLKWVKDCFTIESVAFTLISASTCFLVTFVMYLIYDYEFLFETYLYHFIRADHRHNFSVYFYQLYLTGGKNSSQLVAVLAFLPQILLLLLFSFRFYRDVTFCVFIQTLTFVIFNKVCTVQYFLWYFSILPLVLPFLAISNRALLCLGAAWIGTQGLWLYNAYLLEFQGQNTFFWLWFSGILFFCSGIAVLIAMMRSRRNHLQWRIQLNG